MEIDFKSEMFRVDEKDLLPESNRFDDVMKSLLIEKLKRNRDLSWNDMCLYAAQTRLRKIQKNFKKALLKNQSLVQLIEEFDYDNETIIEQTKKELKSIEADMRYDFDFLFDIIHDIDVEEYDLSDFEDDIKHAEAESKKYSNVPRILIHKKNDK